MGSRIDDTMIDSIKIFQIDWTPLRANMAAVRANILQLQPLGPNTLTDPYRSVNLTWIHLSVMISRLYIIMGMIMTLGSYLHLS